MADKYGRTYHLRLPKALHDKFQHVYTSYRGLQPSVVLRMLVADCLNNKSDDDLREIIDAAIRGETASQEKYSTRIGSTNTRSPQGRGGSHA